MGRYHNIHDQLTVISCEKGLDKTAMLLRTLHYRWDCSLLVVYYFDIYAKIVARAMFPKQRQQRNVSNAQLIEAIKERRARHPSRRTGRRCSCSRTSTCSSASTWPRTSASTWWNRSVRAARRSACC